MNFPTLMDVRYYQSRQRTPEWACRVLVQTKQAPSHPEMIDAVINSHAKIKPSSGELAAHNLLFILASYRRRGKNLQNELERIARNPECAISPEKRAAFAKKWAAKIT